MEGIGDLGRTGWRKKRRGKRTNKTGCKDMGSECSVGKPKAGQVGEGKKKGRLYANE